MPAAAASAIPAAASPSRPSQRLLAAVVVAGAGLLGAGAFVAAGLDSDRSGAKAFTVPFGCGLALLTAAVLVWTIARDAAGRRWMASVLGSIGVLTLAVASLARIGDHAVANYVTGSALLALGVAGYALLGGTVCTVVGSLGVLLVFGQAYSDSNSTGPDASSLLGFGVVLMIIGIVIGAVGWPFSCRNVTGMIGAAIASVAMTLVIIFNGVVSRSAAQPETPGRPGCAETFAWPCSSPWL